MSEQTNEQRKERYDVLSVREYRSGQEIKTQWARMGSAWPNRDGSFNLQLFGVPVPDKDTGLIKLHMRKYEPRDESPGGSGGNAPDPRPTQPPVDDDLVDTTLPTPPDYPDAYRHDTSRPAPYRDATPPARDEYPYNEDTGEVTAYQRPDIRDF